MYKKLILPIVSFVFITYTMMAMLLPSPNLEIITYQCQDMGQVSSYGFDQISKVENCRIEENGEILADNASPKVYYENLNEKFQTIEICFNDQAAHACSILVHLIKKNGEELDVGSYCAKGKEHLVIPVPLDEYQSISIGSNSKLYQIFKTLPFSIHKINLHTEKAIETTEKYQEEYQLLYVLLSIMIGLVLSGLIFFLDQKRQFSEKWFTRENGRKSLELIKKIALGLVICGAIAFLSEYLIGNCIGGGRSNGNLFFVQRYCFILGSLLIVYAFIVNRKTIDKKPEKLFFWLLFIIGVMMVVIAPFGHISWDTDSHYKWTLGASFIRSGIITRADQLIISSVDAPFRIIKAGISGSENTSNILQINQEATIFAGYSHYGTTIAHMLSGVFLAWARFTGLGYSYCLMFAKTASVLIYSIVCCFAMKKLISGKMILAVVSMMPTCLFLSANFSYDYWVICFIIFGMAFFIGEMQRPEKKINNIETIIMCGAFGIACFPKLAYVPLLCIPFLMNRKKMSNQKAYYVICTLMILLVGMRFAFASYSAARGVGDSRGGSDINSLSQTTFIMQNPMAYAGILMRFLSGYLNINRIAKYGTSFAYLGSGKCSLILLAILLITMITDKQECDFTACNWKIRSMVILLFLGISAAIATAMYISFTPVGAETVQGCQGRYLLPLLYPLVSVLGYNRIINPFNQKVYHYLVYIPCCAVNVYLIYAFMLNAIV